MKFINIRAGIVEVPGDSWPVELPELPDDVVMIAFPDAGDPWIEREPFEGREDNAEIVERVRPLLEKPEAVDPDGPDEPEDDEADPLAALYQQLDEVYAEHADAPGADAARDAVMAVIPTLSNPENYDVEVAFRAHLREAKQP